MFGPMSICVLKHSWPYEYVGLKTDFGTCCFQPIWSYACVFQKHVRPYERVFVMYVSPTGMVSDQYVFNTCLAV